MQQQDEADILRMFALNEDHRAIREMATSFAEGEFAAKAIEWDQEKHFPVDVLRKAASLGMGGIYVREEFGGSGLTRLDAALISRPLRPAAHRSRPIFPSTTWRPG